MAGMLFFCKLALYTKLSVLKPSQAIGKKRGQRRATVLASTPKLEARNGHNT